jgi:hypothetical protein
MKTHISPRWYHSNPRIELSKSHPSFSSADSSTLELPLSNHFMSHELLPSFVSYDSKSKCYQHMQKSFGCDPRKLRYARTEIRCTPMKSLETDDQAGRQTLELAGLHTLSIYDAAYLELALRMRASLPSLDNAQKAAAKKVVSALHNLAYPSVSRSPQPFSA